MPSFEKINYSLRPAKNIERKMIAEALRRLSPFDDLHRYHYAGFGAIYFTDFALFHKMLGIQKMTSMERDKTAEPRVRFNRPYKCIECVFDDSSKVLSSPGFWDDRIILWLDYDWKLGSGYIADVRSFCANAQPGSVLMVSVQSESGLDRNPNTPALDELKSRVGEDLVPMRFVANKQLAGWGLADASREIIDNVINSSVRDRNARLDPSAALMYSQLLNFQYSDGAKMLTVGGILAEKAQSPTLASCGFDKLNFYRPGKDAYTIPVPKLTYREIAYLDSKLPHNGTSPLSIPPVPDSDVNAYAKVYRYFPNYADVDL